MIGLRTIRNIVAGALIVATPATATLAAARPNVAVPTVASASASSAQYGNGSFLGNGAWLPLGIVLATLIVGIIIASDNGHNGHGNLSRG